MKTTNKTATTKKAKVMNHLRGGKTLTKTQASTLYGVKNLRATIADIRQNVFSVRTTTAKNGEVAYAKTK